MERDQADLAVGIMRGEKIYQLPMLSAFHAEWVNHLIFRVSNNTLQGIIIFLCSSIDLKAIWGEKRTFTLTIGKRIREKER